MRASFIIPVKSINDYVVETVSHLQRLHDDDWEAFIVTNDVEGSLWKDARVKLLSSGRVGPGDKRDMAAQHATGEVLVFLDDDSYPSSDYLSVLRESLNEGHQVVGGPAVTPTDDTYWQQVSGAMYLSKLTGGSPERYVPRGLPREVDDWPSVNLAIRRQVFLDVGGFDCKFWPGEDTFLCDRLTSAGIPIWYCPGLVVWHHRRHLLSSHLKQVGNYGLHRGYFAKKYRQSSLRPSYFAPSILLGLVIAFIFIPSNTIRILIAIPLFIYLTSQVIGILMVMRISTPGVALGALLYAPISHLWYGVRFLQGFVFTRSLTSKLR